MSGWRPDRPRAWHLQARKRGPRKGPLLPTSQSKSCGSTIKLIAEVDVPTMRARTALFARHPGDVGDRSVSVEIADIFIVAPGGVLADRPAPIGRRITRLDPQRFALAATIAAARSATAATAGASFAMVIDRRQLIIVMLVGMRIAIWKSGIFHAGLRHIGVEILVLVAKAIIMADFLAGNELLPVLGIILRPSKICIVELGRTGHDVPT